MVRLLISDGSWLVLRMAENATRPVPDLTDMPSALPDGSAEGLESHTTRHFPSNTTGSVSFWQLTTEGLQRTKSSSPAKTLQGGRQGKTRGGGRAIFPNRCRFIWALLVFVPPAGDTTPTTYLQDSHTDPNNYYSHLMGD